MTLELKSVSFAYGEKRVVDNVSLAVGAGEKIALMAPSGAGKTTLLRLAAGLIRPHSGEVTGIPATGVGMVFQEDRLIPHLSILDNIAFVAPWRESGELLRLLDALGLGDEAQSVPSQLSGGMKRRAAIARAIAPGSRLVLLDEPFTGLDAATKEIAARFIVEHTSGAAVIAVTHDTEEAHLLGTRIVNPWNKSGASL